jgi:hypothetical protein
MGSNRDTVTERKQWVREEIKIENWELTIVNWEFKNGKKVELWIDRKDWNKIVKGVRKWFKMKENKGNQGEIGMV